MEQADRHKGTYTHGQIESDTEIQTVKHRDMKPERARQTDRVKHRDMKPETDRVTHRGMKPDRDRNRDSTINSDTQRYGDRDSETDRQSDTQRCGDREWDIRVFSFNVSMLLIAADSRQFTDSLFHRCQHVLQLTLLTQDEVQFLVKSRLINLHPLHVSVQLSDLSTDTQIHLHRH